MVNQKTNRKVGNNRSHSSFKKRTLSNEKYSLLLKKQKQKIISKTSKFHSIRKFTMNNIENDNLET